MPAPSLVISRLFSRSLRNFLCSGVFTGGVCASDSHTYGASIALQEKGGENAGATTASGRPSRAKRGGVASPVLNDTPEPDAAHRRHKSGGSSPSVRSGSTSPKLIPTPASLLADTAAASADASGAASDASAHVCPEPDCSKSFRKAALLDSHMRHYHDTDPDATGSTATSPGPTPTTQRRKRPSSDDEEAESDAPVRHDLRQKSKRARVDPPFDEDEYVPRTRS